MADPIQKQIMDAIATRTATITTGAGYRTEIGSKVFRWKAKGWDAVHAADMPGVSISDPTTSEENFKLRSQAAAGGVWENKTRVEFMIAAQLADDSTEQELADYARDAIADIYQMIGTDQKWGGLALWTIPIDHTIQVIQENKTFAGAKVAVDVVYRTKAFLIDTQG